VSVWQNQQARHIVILAHGYGEHLGRYEHVAQFLVERGAVVAGPDHVGHGRSGGEGIEVSDYDLVVDDLHAVVERLEERHPDLPVVLLGHSMGGMIETRARIDTLAFTDLEEVIYPHACHEVFNETNKDEVLRKTADFIDSATNSATRTARA
jgi:alpha-beta hydrolase superfamily lysophospholipase